VASANATYPELLRICWVLHYVNEAYLADFAHLTNVVLFIEFLDVDA